MTKLDKYDLSSVEDLMELSKELRRQIQVIRTDAVESYYLRRKEFLDEQVVYFANVLAKYESELHSLELNRGCAAELIAGLSGEVHEIVQALAWKRECLKNKSRDSILAEIAALAQQIELLKNS